MTIGERIRFRREELHLSQEELAKRLGYKSRSSINKIELGLYNLKQSKIKAIADALETTPSYIMGWDDEKAPVSVVEDERVREFISLFSQLSESQQKIIVAQIKGILAEQ